MGRRYKVKIPEAVEVTPFNKGDLKGKEIRISCREVICKKCGEKFLSDIAKCWESDNPDRIYCECVNSECAVLNHILKVKMF